MSPPRPSRQLDLKMDKRAKKVARLLKRSQVVKDGLLQKQAKERLVRPPAASPPRGRRTPEEQLAYREGRHEKHHQRRAVQREDTRAKTAAISVFQEPVAPSAEQLRRQLHGMVHEQVICDALGLAKDATWRRGHEMRVTEAATHLQACSPAYPGSILMSLSVSARVQVVQAGETLAHEINAMREREEQQQPMQSQARAVWRSDFHGEAPIARSMAFGSATSAGKGGRLEPVASWPGRTTPPACARSF